MQATPISLPSFIRRLKSPDVRLAKTTQAVATAKAEEEAERREKTERLRAAREAAQAQTSDNNSEA